LTSRFGFGRRKIVFGRRNASETVTGLFLGFAMSGLSELKGGGCGIFFATGLGDFSVGNVVVLGAVSKVGKV
jgi:hypothetical protein